MEKLSLIVTPLIDVPQKRAFHNYYTTYNTCVMNTYLTHAYIILYFILIGYSILIQIRLDQQMIPIRILYISLHILKIDS